MLSVEAMNGNLWNSGKQKEVLQDIASKMTKLTGKEFSLKKIVMKFEKLKKRYSLWETIRTWNGVIFNSKTNMLEASEATWNAIKQERPSAETYREKVERLWMELSFIFAGHMNDEILPANNVGAVGMKQVGSARTEHISIVNLDDSESDVGSVASNSVNKYESSKEKGKAKLDGKLHAVRDEKDSSLGESAFSTTAMPKYH